MSDKRWTYKQITNQAEERINSVLELARENPEISHLFWSQARGIHDMWFNLTCGWQEAGDSERLRALIEAATNRSQV